MSTYAFLMEKQNCWVAAVFLGALKTVLFLILFFFQSVIRRAALKI